jgi:hypothetical protein
MYADSIKPTNAVIQSASLSIERGLFLTAWLFVKHANGTSQGFGGHALALTWKETPADLTGHFVMRCLRVAGAESWKDLVGRPIRVKATHDKVHAIGHFLKDDWFDPEADFAKMKKAQAV